MIDGILIVDKPAGFTSHDVVAKVRRILKTRRVGHTGTLDPFATGVMVILVGQATRLAQFLDRDAKEYEATVRLGFETDTGDKTGELRITNDELRSVSAEEIENVLQDFRGEIWQTPPMFSAKKIAGKKLYELARAGVEVERKAVEITIYELEILEKRSDELLIANDERQKNADIRRRTLDFGIRVSCSAGTYIRTLAEDIGRKLETGAHLAALRRTRAGRFCLPEAVLIEELEEIVASDKLGEILISPRAALAHLPEIKLSEKDVLKVKNGMKLNFENENFADDQKIRLTDERENLVAVGAFDATKKVVQPKIVFV